MKKNIIFTCLLVLFLANRSVAQKDVYIKNLNINTENSDFSAGIYQQNKLVYSSTKKLNKFVKRLWKPNMQPYLDLYIGTVNSANDSILNTLPLAKQVNTKYHESSVVFTKDFKTMYFTRNNFSNGKLGNPDKNKKVVLQLFKAEFVSNIWTNVTALPFNSDLYSTGHPALSNDNKKLYFVSDMPGSVGATDIFVVDVLSNNTYSQPKNLGPKINTIGKEMFPFIDENNTLYFSSDMQKNNTGKLDIYASELKNNSYSNPKNIGAPFNSSADDFAFIKLAKENKGYFSSNRTGGKGDDDIYAFYNMPELFKKDCFETINGVVLDKKTNLPLKNVLITFKDSLASFEAYTDSKGVFHFNRKCSLNFGEIKATNKLYKPSSEVVTATNKNELKLYLAKDFTKDDRIKMVNNNLLIVIGEIYFDTNKSFIRTDAAIKLNNLVDIMQKYPSIKVEIGSHTDSRGRASYNMNLSQRRSSAVLEYILSQGITNDRIFSKGYGETVLTNKCSNTVQCTRVQHQMNRRTEFKILNPK